MEPFEALLAQLADTALALLPGALFAQRQFIEGTMAALVFFVIRRWSGQLIKYYKEYPNAQRYGLGLFVIWAIGGLLASISDPIKFFAILVSGAISFIAIVFFRPKIQSHSSGSKD